MSNLPAGAENDPYAPWNQKDKLCRYCDKEEIQEQLFRIIALDSTLDDDRIDEVIEEELDKFYEEFKDKKYALVESALIYEYNIQDQFDEIIFVNSDPKKRKQMAMSRDRITSDEYNRRMRTQMPDELKIEKSKYIITNNYTDQVFDQVKKINELI